MTYHTSQISHLLIKQSRANTFSFSSFRILDDQRLAKFWTINWSVSMSDANQIVHPSWSENFKQSAAVSGMQPSVHNRAPHHRRNIPFTTPIPIARQFCPAFVPGYRVHAKYPRRVLFTFPNTKLIKSCQWEAIFQTVGGKRARLSANVNLL